MARRQIRQQTAPQDRAGEPEGAERDFQLAEDWIRRRRIYPREKKAEDLINHLLARSGFAADESHLELQGAWDSIVGIGVANQTRVGAIRRGVLDVIVANSSLSHHLSIEKQRIIQGLKQILPKANLVDLRFRIGSIG
jgi:hypothetical protein